MLEVVSHLAKPLFRTTICHLIERQNIIRVIAPRSTARSALKRYAGTHVDHACEPMSSSLGQRHLQCKSQGALPAFASLSKITLARVNDSSQSIAYLAASIYKLAAVFLVPVDRPRPTAAAIVPHQEEPDPDQPLPELRRRSTRASISKTLRDPLRFNEPGETSKLSGALLLPASMASLIFAAGFLTYNKVKDKKDKKREKKRKVHEEWYEDLQREHSRSVEEKAGKVQSPVKTGSNPFEDTATTTPESKERRSSSESHRSEDGPDRWVNEVVRERSKSLGSAS